MCHGLYILFAQPASGALLNLVDFVCCCPGLEGLLLSFHDQSLGGYSDVAFKCAGHVFEFLPTSVPGAMQRLLIQGSGFIWLLPGGYKALAFNHQ